MQLPNSSTGQHPISSSWLEKCSSVLLFWDSEFSSHQSHPWTRAYTFQLHLFFSACWRLYNDMLTQLDRQRMKTITWKDGKDLLVKGSSPQHSPIVISSQIHFLIPVRLERQTLQILSYACYRTYTVCPLMILLQFGRSLCMYKWVVDTKKAASPWATHGLSLSILHLLANFVT